MKNIFTLVVFTFIVIVSRSQSVLNEVYPQPGNGNQEFFELYNPGAIERLDNYTLISYYEEAGGKSGFYVLDMPDDSINTNGHYIGASKSPFNIQGQSGIIADVNWNSPGAGGLLTKWEKTGLSYTSVSVPANLNDLFVKITGSGGVFHIFLFKNGILVNGLIGGMNATVIPPYLEAMPDLFVDMSGSSPDFTITFNALDDNNVEYISSSVGTNNGYFRSADGKCGTWLKSDSPGQHTPGQTNGLAANLSGQLNIAAVITLFESDPTKSLLAYKITAGANAAFPVTIKIYSDLGIISEFDINDSLLDSRIVDSASAGTQYVILPSADISVILVANSPYGCYDQVMPVGNYSALLPVHLISFQGNINKNNKVTLQWTLGNNEQSDQFEIQRSNNNSEFKTIGIVFATEKTGAEDYMFYETINNTGNVMYRLKLIDKVQEIGYSKILVFQSKATTSNHIKISGNPVNDKLSFSYTTTVAESIEVKIYDITGRIAFNNKMKILEGSNMINLSLASTFKPGMYVVEVTNGIYHQTAKFIKQ